MSDPDEALVGGWLLSSHTQASAHTSVAGPDRHKLLSDGPPAESLV
jgi:hypothetical protein